MLTAILLSLVMMAGAMIAGGWGGMRHGYPFWQFSARFLFMLWALISYDILVFDYFLLFRSGFFFHFYPEVKPLLGPHLFGYSRKTHMAHIIHSPLAACVGAWICTAF